MLRDLCRRRGGEIVRGSGSWTLQESSMFETQHHEYTCKLKTETLTTCTRPAQVQGMPNTSTKSGKWTLAGLHHNHCCLTKFQPFDIAYHNSPAPFSLLLEILAICYGSFLILFSFGKFLWNLLDGENGKKIFLEKFLPEWNYIAW